MSLKSLSARNQVADDVLSDLAVGLSVLAQVLQSMLASLHDVIQLMGHGLMVMLLVSMGVVVMSMGHSHKSLRRLLRRNIT